MLSTLVLSLPDWSSLSCPPQRGGEGNQRCLRQREQEKTALPETPGTAPSWTSPKVKMQLAGSGTWPLGMDGLGLLPQGSGWLWSILQHPHCRMASVGALYRQVDGLQASSLQAGWFGSISTGVQLGKNDLLQGHKYQGSMAQFFQGQRITSWKMPGYRTFGVWWLTTGCPESQT